MIIVTGCDNTGKTSLVEHLTKEFNIPKAERFPSLPPKGKEWLDYYEFTKQAFCKNEQAIHDRLFIDEFVYGPVKRGGYVLGIAKMAELTNLMLMAQPLLIYTYLPQENIVKSFGDREQFPEVGDIPKIMKQYVRVLHNWPINQLTNEAHFNYLSDSNYRRIDCVVKNYLLGGFI